MKTIHAWLDEYSESHQHPVNKIIHWVCVPLIAFSLLGILWSLPFLNIHFPVYLNWSILFYLFSLSFYFILSWKLALGTVVLASVVFCIFFWLEPVISIFWLSSSIFILAWIGQFIGHHIEGKRPSFYKDVKFLLIGPLWLLGFIYRKLDIAY